MCGEYKYLNGSPGQACGTCNALKAFKDFLINEQFLRAHCYILNLALLTFPRYQMKCYKKNILNSRYTQQRTIA